MGTGYRNFNKSIRGIKGEIAKIRTEGITDEERVNTVNSLWGSMLTRNLSRANQAYYMSVYEFLGVGYQYWDKFIDDLRKVTVREVQLTAEKYMPENNYILATVGKK
jgi:zinc protease